MYKYLILLAICIALFLIGSPIKALALLGFTILTFLYQQGFLRSLSLHKSTLDKGVVIYKDFTRAYSSNQPVFKEVCDLIMKFKLCDRVNLIGFYYDNPQKVPPEKQRASIGIYKKIDGDKQCISDEFDKYALENGYKKCIIEKTDVISSKWEYWMSFGMISFYIGMKQFWNKLVVLLQNKEMQKEMGVSGITEESIGIELYEGMNIVYFMAPFGNVDSLFIHESFNKNN